MITNFTKLANEISSFLTINAEKMLDSNYKDNGTTYYKNLPNQLGIVLGFDEEGYLEASVRVRDSSYFVWDWLYVDEGSFVGVYSLEQIEGIVKYFMDYIKTEEERSDILAEIGDEMYSRNITEFSIEKKDKTGLTCLYNLRDLAIKVIDENDDVVTWNVDTDLLKEFLKDLQESED